MTMSPKYSWTFLLLLNFICVIYSHKCKWLQRNNEIVNKRILETFNQMIPENENPGACHKITVVLPNIDHLYQISQVESAALAIQNLSNHIIQFYTEYKKDLGWNQEVWEKKLQALLYYQKTQLADCVTELAENHFFAKEISQHFHTLEKIMHDQADNMMCAQRIIHSEIGRNLQLANQLSSRMRRQQPVKMSQ